MTIDRSNPAQYSEGDATTPIDPTAALPSGVPSSTIAVQRDLGDFLGGFSISRGWLSIAARVVVRDAANAAVRVAQTLLHVLTAGTPANGIGVEQDFGVQTGAGPQNFVSAAKVKATVTDVVASTAKYEIVVRKAGADQLSFVLDPAGAATSETALLLTVNKTGTLTTPRVSYGADDSGGTGFALLRIPNP